MQQYWFGDREEGVCTPAPARLEDALARLATLRTPIREYVLPDWQWAVECGYVKTRDEYLHRLQELCLLLAEQKVAVQYQAKDVELLQMVRTLDQMDEVINLLTERAVDWYTVKHPKFSRKFKSMNARKLLASLAPRTKGPLGMVMEEIERLSVTRTALMREVSSRSDLVLPNCSALVGGLVAARLLSTAGGLEPLARLPGSSVQVLGSRTALFSHIRSGTPSPKHGIIFQHRRVHNAPPQVRGRVSRVLAAKLAIAARLDLYRGEPDQTFIDKAQQAIDAAGRVA